MLRFAKERFTTFGILLLFIIVLAIIYFLLKGSLQGSFTNSLQNNLAKEGFINVPKNISYDSREDISTFLDTYITIGSEVCEIEEYVIEGIAKLLKGINGGDTTITKTDLANAKVKAKSMMIGGRLFDCDLFKDHKDILAKETITIEELYSIFEDIPDTIGYNLWTTSKFCKEQIELVYKQIETTLSPIKSIEPYRGYMEGFTEVVSPTTSPLTKCSEEKKCPTEMAKEISARIKNLTDNISKAETGFDTDLVPISTYISSSKKMISTLTTLKEKAESGTLLS